MLKTKAGGLLRPEQAAEYLNINPKTLANWRVAGTRPRFVHISRRAIRYRMSDIDEFVESNIVASTAAPRGK